MRAVILGISLLCLTVSIEGDPVEYDLTSFCGSSISVYSAAILKVDDYWAQGECEVTVYSNFHNSGDDKLRVQVLAIGASCGSQSVELYDGDPTTGSLLSGSLCGYSTDTIETMYVSFSSDFVTVRLHADYSSFTNALRLLATATAYSYESTDFICNNNYDVRSYLQCDGYNNCGDWSDEHSLQCDDNDVISWSLQTSVVAGAGVLCFIVIIIIIVLVIKGRRRRRQYALLNANNGFAQGPPAYGSVQVGVNSGYLPVPPPYAGKTGTVTPPPPYCQAVTMPPPSSTLQAAAPPPSASSPQPPATTTSTSPTMENVTAAAADVAP